VNRESKVLIGVGVLAIVGLLLALSTSATLGVLVIAIGLVGGVVYLRATRPDQTDPFAEARSAADETNVGNITPNEPLAPWSPEGGLTAWTPPADLAPQAPLPPFVEPTYGRLDEPSYGRLDEPPAYEPPAYEPPAFDPPAYEPPAYEPPAYEAPAYERTFEPTPEPATNWDDTSWEQSVTWDPPAPPAPPAPSAPPPPSERNPLDDLVGLDRMDPVAEVQRIDERETAAPARSEGITFDGRELDIHGNAVNEAVTGADDIMAASQATELHLANGEQTELQKLLAKVQIRLSAYE